MFLYYKKKFIKFSYNFSTRLLTLLTIGDIVIPEIEQYRGMKLFYLPTLTNVNFYLIREDSHFYKVVSKTNLSQWERGF